MLERGQDVDSVREMVSVVIPAYNEEGLTDVVSGLRSRLTSCGRPFEMIVVDDGSQAGLRRDHERKPRAHGSLRVGDEAGCFPGPRRAQPLNIVVIVRSGRTAPRVTRALIASAHQAEVFALSDRAERVWDGH
jgi:hypothetical protein